jgi:hypothetical protein
VVRIEVGSWIQNWYTMDVGWPMEMIHVRGGEGGNVLSACKTS